MPIKISQYGAKVFVNVSGLSDHSQITVEILNERFERLEGYTSSDFIPLKENSGFRIPIKWKQNDVIITKSELIRIRVNWDGLRLEDARIYAVYIENISSK
jgi:hypothetical protein